MSIKYFDHKDGIKTLTKLLLNEKLTPIIGSGFTAGCNSLSANVPNGPETMELMKEIISSVNKSIDLEKLDFNTTAERFYQIVDKEKRDSFFRKFFTEVAVSDELKNILELPWSYIFTLNVDDGIEKTGLYKPIYPYQDAKMPNQSTNLVYKIHGDAYYEIHYNVENNIVFSSSQYLSFLYSSKNTTIINAIQSDYKQKNLLFIGCSLKSEPDLKHIYNTVKSDISSNGLRVVLRSKKLSTNEELDLESYGINSVIIVDNYRSFYIDFVTEFHKLKANEDTKRYLFTNPKIEDLSENKEKTLEYFAGKNIFNSSSNLFYKSGMQIVRSKIDIIEDTLNKTNAIIIQGRRFSGKTNLLCNIAERFTKYDVMYFPSDAMYDEDLISKMLNETNNCIFLFDSNSLSEYAYQEVAHSIELLQKNDNKLVIALNSKDTFLSENLNAEIIHISPKFRETKELAHINEAADKYSLIRRQIDDTSIDYIKRIIDEQKIKIAFPLTIPKDFSKNEKIILFLLCVNDKLYYGDISVLGIPYREVDVLLNSMKGIIEKTPVSRGEISHHSSEKLIHNSKYVLLSIMNELNSTDIVDIITYIVSKSLSDRSKKRLYVETVLFDTLNQLFGKKSGAGGIIYQIYDDLEKYLYSSMDYWLQRAKSIYRLNPKIESELFNAYRYAKKAYCDGNNSVHSKSALTLSLICCLLSEVLHNVEDKTKYELEAIDYAYEAVTSNYFKKIGNARLNAEFETTSKSSESYYRKIIKICNKQYDNIVLQKTTTIQKVLSDAKKNS